jgi:hypothetical protein
MGVSTVILILLIALYFDVTSFVADFSGNAKLRGSTPPESLAESKPSEPHGT